MVHKILTFFCEYKSGVLPNSSRSFVKEKYELKRLLLILLFSTLA